MRKSGIYLLYAALNAGVLALLLLVSPLFGSAARESGQQEGRRLVQELGLTDLALFTEARYTRHLTQADFHAPFQDHPMAMEHFPSGSLVGPPSYWRIPEHEMD